MTGKFAVDGNISSLLQIFAELDLQIIINQFLVTSFLLKILMSSEGIACIQIYGSDIGFAK